MTENYLTQTTDNNEPADYSAQNSGRSDTTKVPAKFIDPQTGEVRLDALINSYLSMEKKLSTMIPSVDTEDGRDKVLRQLGRPETVHDYQIDLSHGLFDRDEECDQCMHEKGFTNDQAQLVYDLAARKMVPLIVQMASEFQADREIERLADKFGGPEQWREVSRQLLSFGRKNLPEDVLSGLAGSYEGVMALYRMMQQENPQTISPKSDAVGPAGEQDLKAMIRDPRYWKKKDPAFIKKVTEGFQRIYGQD